jgi:MoxR-like ATPase
MSKRPIDRLTRYTGSQDFSAPKSIDVLQVDGLPAGGQPLRKPVVLPPEPYLPDDNLRENTNIAIALGRPLLLQGDPGCGKTRLAYALSYELGLPLEAAYIKSTSRAQDLLYTYDAVRRLYDAQLNRPEAQQPHPYLRLGPLGRAIARAWQGQRSIVLIDEIDKADLDFPNDLLYELDRLTFSIPEAGDLSFAAPEDDPLLRPIVVITHNEEKALPAPFLRRCVYDFVEMPTDEGQLLKILALNACVDEDFNRQALAILKTMRSLNLDRKPGLSELIDWVSYLQARSVPASELNKLPHLGALIKQLKDQQAARQGFAQA